MQPAIILVTGQTITPVGSAGSLAIPTGATVIDLSAVTCLPGLIDAHVHITSDPNNSGYKSLGISVPRATLTGAKNARTTLQAGALRGMPTLPCATLLPQAKSRDRACWCRDRPWELRAGTAIATCWRRSFSP